MWLDMVDWLRKTFESPLQRVLSTSVRNWLTSEYSKGIIPFRYGCTVDEMLARSKEEQVGYFVRRVEGPIVHGPIPSSRLVTSHSSTSSSEWLQRHPPRNGTIPNRAVNGNYNTNSLPLNGARKSRRIFGAATPSTPTATTAGRRAQSSSPNYRSNGGRTGHRVTFPQNSSSVADESFYVAGDDLDLHTSLRNGVPVFMYSPHTKRRLLRVA